MGTFPTPLCTFHNRPVVTIPNTSGRYRPDSSPWLMAPPSRWVQSSQPGGCSFHLRLVQSPHTRWLHSPPPGGYSPHPHGGHSLHPPGGYIPHNAVDYRQNSPINAFRNSPVVQFPPPVFTVTTPRSVQFPTPGLYSPNTHVGYIPHSNVLFSPQCSGVYSPLHLCGNRPHTPLGTVPIHFGYIPHIPLGTTPTKPVGTVATQTSVFIVRTHTVGTFHTPVCTVPKSKWVDTPRCVQSPKTCWV